MAISTAQIRVAGTGQIYVAAVGSTQPTNPTSAFSGAWVDIGATSEDGVKFKDSKDITDIGIWQNFYPARKIIKARQFEASFVMRQWNGTTLKLAFGGGTLSVPSGGVNKYVPPSPATIDERALGIDWQDGSYHYRLIVPKGLVTESVETDLKRDGASDLPITFAALGVDAADPWLLLTDDPAIV